MHFDDGALLAARSGLGQFQADVAVAVTPGIFKQVANQPAQQSGRPLHRQAVAGIRAGRQFGLQLGIDTRTFLCGQPGQVQRFKRFCIGLFGIEPAGQQDFIDQLVEFVDAAGNFHALRGRHVHAHQFESHADTRQRRSQLVRSIGQQRFVRIHQGFDAFGRMVETAGQESHLVAPFGIDARRQIARAPAFHATLQGLQAQRQAPHDRVGAQRHGQPDQAQHPAKTKRWPVPGIARGPLGPRQQQVQALAVGGNHIKLNVLAALSVRLGLRRADDVAGGVVHQHFAYRQLGRVGAQLPGGAHQKSQHHDGCHHGKPDAHIKVRGKTDPHLHLQSALSLAAWQIHSPRRARSGCVWGPWRLPRWRCGCGPCERQSSGQRPRVRVRAPLP